MVRYKILSALVGGALVAGSVAACGGSSSKNTSQAVQAAAKATANQSGLKLTASLKASPSDLSGSGSSSLTTAQKQAILNSTLALQVNAANGTTLANAGNGGELDLTLAESGSTLAETRVVGSTLYVQVNIDKVTSTYGLDKGRAAQLHSQLQQLGSQVGGLGALDKGQWVSVDISALNTLTQTAGITLPSAPQLVGRLVASFFNALSQSNNITSAGSGKAQINVSAQQVVTSLAQTVQSAPGMSSFANQINGLAQRAHNAVPANNTGNVVVTTSGGIVSNLDLPINQFDTSHKLKGPASVSMAVAKAGAVSAPSGATALNLPQLIRALQGSSTSSG